MNNDYNYDDNAQFFPYFILTIAAVLTAPVTYSALKPAKLLENTATRIESDFRPEKSDLIDKQRWRQKRRERKLKRMIAAGVGWLVMAAMVYLIVVTARTTHKIWDPYDILGVQRSATEKEIKSFYKRLSLTQHPDKRKPDPAKNETVESINNDWVDKTKAFKALTDEDIRNNYLLYGNPDGKQSMSIGIALPQFIVQEGNGKYVLLVYASLLGVLLPYLVGKWWYGTQKVTKEDIYVRSAGRLFSEYEEDMNEGTVVGVLSGGEEFAEALKNSNEDNSAASVERLVLANENSSLKMTMSDRNKLTRMTNEERRKALAILWAYLGRIDLDDSKLNEQKFGFAPLAFSLNEAFAKMTPLFGNTQPLLASYRMSQNLIQALAPGASPLLQVPHFTPAIVSSLESSTLTKNMTVQSFMSLPADRRKKLLVGNKLLSEPQYSTAMSVASQFPYARIETAFFKVAGERFITPSSLVQFVVKLRIIPPGYSPIPPVDPLELEDADPKEGDLEALHGQKKKKSEDGDAVDEDEDYVQPPLAHGPYFAQDHSPRWMVFLGENKSDKIAVPPFTFSTFDKPIFDKDTGKPTCNVQTLKMQFQAPNQEGEYPFTMWLVNDSYAGFDLRRDISLKVESGEMAEEIEDEGEISEPDEDSLAGQMNALKGSSSGAKPKSKSKVPQDLDDISSGSDTEGEEDDDSDTDTDTDTDEE